jgi:hypothetical protein
VPSATDQFPFIPVDLNQSSRFKTGTFEKLNLDYLGFFRSGGSKGGFVGSGGGFEGVSG